MLKNKNQKEEDANSQIQESLHSGERGFWLAPDALAATGTPGVGPAGRRVHMQSHK